MTPNPIEVLRELRNAMTEHSTIRASLSLRGKAKVTALLKAEERLRAAKERADELLGE